MEQTEVELPFADRTEAGHLLAAELARHKFASSTIVLALPRGGVPVGAVVANRLHTPLDVVVVRKLGVPWQPELAMGAIAGSVVLLDEGLVRKVGISGAEVERIVSIERAQVGLREQLFRNRRPMPNLQGREVILVDDGLATGSTMLAAVRYVRAIQPERLTVAVPVGSEQACECLRREADRCVCLTTPEPFFAVGEWYRDFQQVTNEQVRELLAGIAGE